MRITESNFYEEALIAMKSVPPNSDGMIGFTVTPSMPEWARWQAYFLGKRMDNRAANMRNRGQSGYMVPCRDPGNFDPDIAEVRVEYLRRVQVGEVPRPDTSRRAREIPFQERVAMVQDLANVGRRIAEKSEDAFSAPRGARARPSDYIPPVPSTLEHRPLTKAETASARRLMGLPQAEPHPEWSAEMEAAE